MAGIPCGELARRGCNADKLLYKIRMEIAETIAPIDTKSPRLRSRVTNGSAIFARGGDGRSAWTRRFKDLYPRHINDYGGEGAGYPKSEKMYALVQGLLARGAPLDGVGLQLHVSVNAYPPPAAVAANIARLGALGLKVHVTEFDVTCPPAHCNASDPASPGFAAQAALYGAMLRACLSNTGVCTAFQTWGFTDKYSWETWCGKEPGCQALPFDRNYSAKLAADEMLAVLEE